MWEKSVVKERGFEICRPVYIEMDTEKTKYVETSKVQYLVGALTVVNLGVFYPPLSDTEEAIVTSNYVCSRWFWSTVEPWKIVQYKITTSIFVPKINTSELEEQNFTVDYSLGPEIIEEQLKEISLWKKKHEYDKFGDNRQYLTAAVEVSTNNNPTGDVTDEKVVSQVLEHIVEYICSKEIDENCDEEPQNTADLLPPELKDAIFEDLPHDLLDGISMQDIFPKLMSFEDIIVSNEPDNKTDEIINTVDSDEFLQLKCKKNDLFISENDFWLEPKCLPCTNDITTTKNTGTELKRSKSEVFSEIKKLTRNRNHQRSCSLTWSCKLDNSSIKKRKISCTSKNDISSNFVMVVDGTGDKTGMLQELRLPDGVLMTVERTTNSECDTVREIKYKLEENTILSAEKLKPAPQQLELGKENKCRLWNKTQTRFLQVDGADSDSDSEIENDDAETKKLDEPVKCDRCQCTYRTHSSYKKHLSTCEAISTESDSDEEEHPPPSVNYIVEINENQVYSIKQGPQKETNVINEPATSVVPNGTVKNEITFQIKPEDVVGAPVQPTSVFPMQVDHVATANQTIMINGKLPGLKPVLVKKEKVMQQINC